jgi:diadenosine tetraphosphate (Ap4A) HIT family hydrolase
VLTPIAVPELDDTDSVVDSGRWMTVCSARSWPGDEELARVARTAGRVARLLRGALDPAGVNLVHATGVAAWQSVFHFHLHVVPRYRADELQVMWHAAPVPDADLAALRTRVLAANPS